MRVLGSASSGTGCLRERALLRAAGPSPAQSSPVQPSHMELARLSGRQMAGLLTQLPGVPSAPSSSTSSQRRVLSLGREGGAIPGNESVLFREGTRR